MIAKNYVVEKRILLALFFTSIGIAYFNVTFGFILFVISTIFYCLILSRIAFDRDKSKLFGSNVKPLNATKEFIGLLILGSIFVIVSAISRIMQMPH